MEFNFDKQVPCSGRDSLKHDFCAKRGKPEGILPMWVADMDFPAPQPVLEALEERSRHGVFGYTDTGEDYVKALTTWFGGRFGYELNGSWLVKTPGVVYAICMAIQAFTKEGEAVLIQEPVYYPFRESVLANKRRLVVNELRLENGSYQIDFAAFERQVREEDVKLFILCSPHNPVGRVWSAEELRRLGEICRANNVLVVSDEIHADFAYGRRHTMFPTAGEGFGEMCILCTAPSKTFNLAGLQVSNVFIQNRALRTAFKKQVQKSGYSQLNTMGLLACRVAYEQGGEWLDALLAYLGGNIACMKEQLFAKTDAISLIEPEGTYLLWMDLRHTGLSDEEIDERMVHKANLWLDNGRMFGESGAGFQRINIAYPRAVVQKACEGMLAAFGGL